MEIFSRYIVLYHGKILHLSTLLGGLFIMLLWDAFLEDYRDEIFNWSPRQLLEIFWHYCQDGNRAVYEFLNKDAILTPAAPDGEGDATCTCNGLPHTSTCPLYGIDIRCR